MSTKTLSISPNTTLSEIGLFINGEGVPLGHIGNFKTFVLNTSVHVSSILDKLFPNPCGVPNSEGDCVKSDETAAEHYLRHVYQMQVLENDSPRAVQVGRVLLQWCLSAVVAAKLIGDGTAELDEFLPINYLIHQGAHSLTCTPRQWEAYLCWRAWRGTQAGVEAELNGTAPRNPLAGGVAIVAPWPELLGANLGGEAKLFENACAVSTDILFNGTTTHLRVGRHSIRCDVGAKLADMFDDKAVSNPESIVELGLSLAFATTNYFIRSVRHRLKDGRFSYCFRVLPG